MACFVVPAAEAVITTVASKIIKSKESSEKTEVMNEKVHLDGKKTIPFSKKMGWLNNMLWGGSALLAFEHLWHGEIVPYFPFLSGAANPQDAAQMLHEMSTTGVTMAVLVTGVWGIMVAVSRVLEKKTEDKTELMEKK